MAEEVEVYDFDVEDDERVQSEFLCEGIYRPSTQKLETEPGAIPDNKFGCGSWESIRKSRKLVNEEGRETSNTSRSFENKYPHKQFPQNLNVFFGDEKKHIIPHKVVPSESDGKDIFEVRNGHIEIEKLTFDED
jgi:hypothetical protein